MASLTKRKKQEVVQKNKARQMKAKLQQIVGLTTVSPITLWAQMHVLVRHMKALTLRHSRCLE